MELDQLRYFLRVSSDLNITGSASKLYITQQTLSKSIRRLEDELGVVLFTRESKGLRLTDDGKYLKKAVRDSVTILDNACTHLRIKSGQLRTLLRVGVISGCIALVKHICMMFAAENLYVDFEISEQMDDVCGELLLDKKLDVAYMTGPVDDKRFAYHLVNETPWCMVMPAGHPLSEKKSLKVADILSYPVIDGTDQCNAYREFEEYCSKRVHPLQFRSRTLDSATRIIHCKRGEGLALFSVSGAKSVVASDSFFTYVPIDEDIKLKLCVAVPKEEHISGETQEFWEFATRRKIHY